MIAFTERGFQKGVNLEIEVSFVMKNWFIALFCLVFCGVIQAQNFEQEVLTFQEELNAHYKSKEKSPLEKKARRKFKGHNFFPMNKKFRVVARFEKADSTVSFAMKTSSTRLPMYDVYGKVYFEIDGVEYALNVYQSHKSRATEKYKNSLFLPFTDVTNGEESYGGGRYLDLTIPEGNTMIIDFNQAYSPYCAYSSGYSCPIPPRENDLNIKVKAGVMNLEVAGH